MRIKVTIEIDDAVGSSEVAYESDDKSGEWTDELSRTLCHALDQLIDINAFAGYASEVAAKMIDEDILAFKNVKEAQPEVFSAYDAFREAGSNFRKVLTQP